MAKVIIFGVRDFAQLAKYYLEHDSEHEPAAFCVTESYLPEERTFEGLTVEAFETIEQKYPASEYSFFAPLSPRGMNRMRKDVYRAIKEKGYDCISYISSKATVFSDNVGENCFILEDNTIQPFTSIGNNVVMWSGNHIGHHSRIGDDVFFTSHVVLSGHCDVGESSFFGVNSTIRDRVTIGEGTLIGMGACVLKDTEPWSVYVGNPAVKHPKPSFEIGTFD
ncbi:MAG: acetyltransferase [Ignavibacteriae bacterium]|nr:acetyltransferase [Ignavibacteriota bacterium]MCB9244040.1 acetyltransferase [Ignavibacteriales bacterium]